MYSLQVYCKPNRRRPILLGSRPFPRDIQADIPRGWCRDCGAEVFTLGQNRCPYCRKERRYDQ